MIRVPFLCALGLLTGCSDPAPPPAKDEAKHFYSPPPSDRVIDDPVVRACLERFPRDNGPDPRIDREQLRSNCIKEVGKQATCELAKLMSSDAAACIAQGFGLPLSSTWNAQLRVSQRPPHRILWRVHVPNSDDERLLDARTGELIQSTNSFDTRTLARTQ